MRSLFGQSVESVYSKTLSLCRLTLALGKPLLPCAWRFDKNGIYSRAQNCSLSVGWGLPDRELQAFSWPTSSLSSLADTYVWPVHSFLSEHAGEVRTEAACPLNALLRGQTNPSDCWAEPHFLTTIGWRGCSLLATAFSLDVSGTAWFFILCNLMWFDRSLMV